MKSNETLVQTQTFLFQNAHFHMNPGITHLLHTQTVHFRKRIHTAHHNLGNTARDYQIGARRCLSIVGTRFQTHIKSAFLQKSWLAHTTDCIHLGMRASTLAVIPLTNDLPLPHHHGSHHGIWCRPSLATPGKLDAASHVALVLRCHVYHLFPCVYDCLFHFFHNFAA